MSAPEPYSLPRTNQVVLERLRPHLSGAAEILDVGAGEGYLTGQLHAELQHDGHTARLRACDLFPEQFQLIRELHRVTAPGGRLVFTTPNILNINSRIRYLMIGFPELFDILPLGTTNPVGDHINPTTAYYACYMTERAGYRVEDVLIDRVKRSGVISLVLWPLMKLYQQGYHRRMKRKFPEVYQQNRRYLQLMNSYQLLVGRTIIVEARR